MLSFQRSTRLDERWRLKEELLLGEVERDLSTDLHKILHEAESSAAQYVTQEVFKHHYERAEQQYDIIRNLTRPYLERRIGSKGVDIQELWEREFGALDDEDVQAGVEAFVAQATNEVKKFQESKDDQHKPTTAGTREVTKWS